MASTPETIVVGIDGTACSDEALQWAIEEAHASRRALLLVHVWHWRTDALASPMSLVGAPDARKAGRHLLDRAVARARRDGVSATTRLVEGAPATALTAAAEGAAMLVVGSHGYRRLTTALIGSVSRGCVQHAHCPVVVIPAGLRPPNVVRPAASTA
jgi:nucleotide-binding universal stress UspA family protein